MPAPPAPSPVVVAALYARAEAEGEGGGAVELAEHLHPARLRLHAYLAMIAEGAPSRAAGDACGLPWAVWWALIWSDTCGGLRRLDAAAIAMRDEAWRERAVAAIYTRAVEGVDEPVYGRVGQHQDGVIGAKRVYSDRLLALAVERREAAFRRAPAAASVQHIGQQVIYNLHGLLDGASVPAPIDIEAEDV